MNTAFKIAKLELGNLFFSPIAWLVLIVFTIQGGLQFSETVGYLIRNQHLGYPNTLLTENVFSMPPMGLLFSVQSKLYLYIPLLTMGLISRELSSGSIKLVFSSPVTLAELVVGKFFAMAVYGMVLLGILTSFALVAYVYVPHLDLLLLLSGFIGLYLLICAYSAIGLFMSSLTSYQVVAAVSTLVVLGVLSYIGNIGQRVDVLRDITYYLSISGRSDELITGLISSKDVLYFVILTVFFLTLTVLKLRGGREAKPLPVVVGRYMAVIVIMAACIYATSRPTLIAYADMTANKRRTLTENSQQIVRQLTEPLKMTTYVNLLDINATYGFPDNRLHDLKRFENYTRFLPNMDVSYVYYYDRAENPWLYEHNQDKDDEALARMMADQYDLSFDKFLSPAAMREQIDLSGEENRMVRLFTYAGKQVFVRMFDDMMVYPSEQEITAALKTFLHPAPKVLFLTGHFERRTRQKGDQDYQMIARQNNFRYALLNQGFSVDTLSLRGDTEIPRDIAALVIADPKRSYSADELASLKRYIDQGGNVLVTGEFAERNTLTPLLDLLGVSVESGTLVQQSKDFDPQFVLASFAAPTASNVTVLQDLFIPQARLSFNGAAALRVSDTTVFTHYPIILTDPADTWKRLPGVHQDSTGFRFDATEGDRKGEWPIAIAATRDVAGRQQRVFVVGDADFLSNRELQRGNVPTSNLAFTTSVFKWFSYGEFPIHANVAATRDNVINMDKDGLMWVNILLMGLLPCCAAIAGGMLLYRRKVR